MTKKHKLSKLQLSEVSLVRAGMNPGADILLFKARDPAGSPGNVDHKENEMTDKEKAELTAQLKKEAEDKVSKELARAKSMATMSDAEKTYLTSLAKDKQDAFLECEAGKRAEFVKANPVKVDDGESIIVSGVTVKKGEVGDAMFAVLKAQNAQIETLSALAKSSSEGLEMAQLEKEAINLWPHTAGTPAEKAVILKSIKGMPKSQQDLMLATMKGSDEAMKSRLSIIGKEEDPSAVDPTPASEIAALVAKEMKESKCDEATATVTVLKANPVLYAAFNQKTLKSVQKPN